MNKITRFFLLLISVVLMAVGCCPLIGNPSQAPRSKLASSISMRGVNLAGAEFGTARPGAKGTDYTWPTKAEVDYFTSKGMNTFRVGFMWERLQPTAGGAFNATYAADLDAIVVYATSKGAMVVLNPHNYARYYDKVLGSEAPTSAFVDLWSKLAVKYKGNPKVVFGLVNEPHDMNTEQWVSVANQATAAIRATGAANLVSVPGNGWTGAHSWTSNWYGTSNAVALLAYSDSGNNSVFEVHNYFDSDGGGGGSDCVSGTVGADRMASVVAWARQHGKKVWVGEFGTSNTATCKTAVSGFLNYMQANSDVVVGWAWWAAGPWWGNYALTIEPQNGVDRPQMAWLTPYLGASPPTPTPSPVPNPIAYTKGQVFTIAPGGVTSWVWVPPSYDSTHATPTKMFVWLHGCGGKSQYDVSMVSYMPNQSWISLAVGGREGTCWSNYATDGAKILAAIADMKTHFNIDPKRVVLGGYSSGGDIGYELAFKNASLFSGVLFENTNPSAAAMTASTNAAWKLNIAHLAHTGDTVAYYAIANVRNNMNTLKGRGFPVTLIEKPGAHWANDSGQTGTEYDLRTFLLPYLDAGWVSGVVAPPPPPPACSFAYSAWSACQSNSTQTRTATSSPVGCVGTPTLSQMCTYVPPVCVFTYSIWGECQSNGTQTRAVTLTNPAGCAGGTPITSQTCAYTPPTPVDTDGDGVLDADDAYPMVKGIKSTVQSINGCPGLVVSATKTHDWGTGYCKQYYFQNNNPMPMPWVKMVIYLKDGRLRGAKGVWGAKFKDPTATGRIVVRPLAQTKTIAPGQKLGTVGFCVDYGPSKYVAQSGGLWY